LCRHRWIFDVIAGHRLDRLVGGYDGGRGLLVVDFSVAVDGLPVRSAAADDGSWPFAFGLAAADEMCLPAPWRLL